jgi:spore coat protein CotF
MSQEKPTVKSQVAANVKMSDHDRIEKLLGEVEDLQNKLAALTRKYEMHTHQLSNAVVAQLPSSIECNQTVVQWSADGINRDPVYSVCRQLSSEGKINVLVQGKESTVTGTPRP